MFDPPNVSGLNPVILLRQAINATDQ